MNDTFDNLAKTSSEVSALIPLWEAAESFAGINIKIDYYIRFHIVMKLTSNFTRRKTTERKLPCSDFTD